MDQQQQKNAAPIKTQRGAAQAMLIAMTALLGSGGLFLSHRILSSKLLSHAPSVSSTGAFKKNVNVGCGCSALYAELPTPPSAPPLVGYWAPPAASYSREEIADLPTVLLLKAGMSLPIKALVWNKKLGPKAVWTAANGTVDAAGKYTAPPYTPSRGDDILTLSDPSNVFINGTKIRIHILPNPAIPGSAKTPYIKYTPAGTTTGPGSHVYYSHKLVLPPDMASVPPQFLKNIPVVFGPEYLPAPSAPVTVVTPAETTGVSGQSVYTIPAESGFGQPVSGFTLPVSSVSQPLMKAKELPLYAGNSQTNPDPRLDARSSSNPDNLNTTADPNTENEGTHKKKKCKDTKVHLISLGTVESQSSASVVILTITGGAKGGIDIDKAFTIDLDVGVELPISVTETTYVQTKTWDMMQCHNGKTKKIGQKICTNHDQVRSDAQPTWVDTFFKDVEKYSKYRFLGGLRSVVPKNYDGTPDYLPKFERCNKTYINPML